MLRSEKVECVYLYCSADGLKNTVEKLGEASIVQFRENSKKNKNFDEDLKSLESAEQKLSYLKNEIKSIAEDNKTCKSDRNENTTNCMVSLENHRGPTNDLESIIEIKLEIEKYYKRLIDLKSDLKKHKSKEKMLYQNLKMLEISKSFSMEAQCNPDSFSVHFDFITAVSDLDKKDMIKTLIKYKMRRNVYIKTHECKDFVIFIIYVIGDHSRRYIEDIIKNSGGRCLDDSHIDNKTDEKNYKSGDQNNKKKEKTFFTEMRYEYKKIKKYNSNTEEQLDEFLHIIRNNFVKWRYHLNKEKTILQGMKNLVKIENTECYCGEAWVLQKDLEKLNLLKSFDSSKGRFMFQPTKPGTIESSNFTEITRPTYFSNTEFTRPFQNLTNVFGVPKYREINPAVFLIFTFPFLFGVMFGDILHGLILLSLAVFLITCNKKLDGKCGVFQMILEGRYVVLTCAFASIWFGALYGDFGSLPVQFFPSQYEIKRTYPFGIDPIWHHASNKMVFVNSLKMKLSLIIGFAHMGLGSLISISNSIYDHNKIDLVCVAIPQFIAFSLFLGYLVFLCIYKWLVTVTYPSLVNTLISMYTDPFNMKNQMYPGQLYVQLLIFSIILICIPYMFFSKPIYLILKKKIPKDGMLDMWITSGIHVVEFCLGLISNTSSYLRLWAVSLAHVQLTSVLHEFTIGNSNTLVKLITFPIYFSGTFLLLIGLEGLSSCLHALRLNWIEFFSKFYKGGGEEFRAFNFEVKDEE